METYILDWAGLLLRWLHVITAIAWVGSSFYFVFLDSSLTPPIDDDLKKQGVSGELWAVHGGGFYHPVKFNVSPPKMPDHLHWFYWESYTTWLSGFALLTVSYLWNANIYLVTAAVLAGMLHGIEQGFDPGPPITGNAYDQTEIRTPFWREAIAAFMGSEFIREQFGTSFQHIYGQQKLKEMHSFYTEVTDLEYAWYLRSV